MIVAFEKSQSFLKILIIKTRESQQQRHLPACHNFK